MGPAFTRRSVLRLAASVSVAPWLLTEPRPSVRFGVIADVHHGLAPDAHARLSTFKEAVKGRNLDFVLQLGDFNHPEPEAMDFLALWRSIHPVRHSVLGNHDMDKGSKAEAMARWGMPARHYSFDHGGVHFVVLDANHLREGNRIVPYEKANWYRSGITASWVDADQLEWLAEDLLATQLPTVAFVHQCIDDIRGGGDVPNRAEVRRVLNEVGRGRVIAVLQGHAHQDVHQVLDGIHYVRLNSASYAWVGSQFGGMAPYDRALYAFVEVDGYGTVSIEGVSGAFRGQTPSELGVPEPERFASTLSSRRLERGARRTRAAEFSAQ